MQTDTSCDPTTHGTVLPTSEHLNLVTEVTTCFHALNNRSKYSLKNTQLDFGTQSQPPMPESTASSMARSKSAVNGFFSILQQSGKKYSLNCSLDPFDDICGFPRRLLVLQKTGNKNYLIFCSVMSCYSCVAHLGLSS